MITDLSYLKTMSDGDERFIKEMIDIFTEQIGQFKIEMPELHSKGELILLSKLAHKAKSSVAVMGMTREADLLKDLENNAKDGLKPETYKETIDTFICNSEKAIEELSTFPK